MAWLALSAFTITTSASRAGSRSAPAQVPSVMVITITPAVCDGPPFWKSTRVITWLFAASRKSGELLRTFNIS